jgi:hypothetical protein
MSYVLFDDYVLYDGVGDIEYSKIYYIYFESVHMYVNCNYNYDLYYHYYVLIARIARTAGRPEARWRRSRRRARAASAASEPRRPERAYLQSERDAPGKRLWTMCRRLGTSDLRWRQV